MRIDCLNGYFKITEAYAGDAARFSRLFSVKLVRVEDFITFEGLKDCPEYSVKGSSFLGATATATYAGKPWEVFKANGFVYNFQTGLIIPAAQVVTRVALYQSLNYYFTQGLLLPGSILFEGQKVSSYLCRFSFGDNSFKYSEVSFD